MVQFDARSFEKETADFSDPVKAAVWAAVRVGIAISASDDTSLFEVTMKEGDTRGERKSMATGGDFLSQRQLVSMLAERFPRARFIAEEAAEGYQDLLIKDKDVPLIGDAEVVYGIDPVDGTTQFGNKLWEWSISIGIMQKGVHTGGVIFAPHVLGGLLVAGEKGKGVFLAEDGGMRVAPVRIAERTREKSLMFCGVGLDFLPEYNRFVNQMYRAVIGTKSVGSCALGLAAVAAGRVDALVQPAQRPYDWSGGFPIVEQAGGKFQFYHYRNHTP